MQETQLIKKILDGDKESFRVLVDEYKNLAAAIVYRVVKNRDDTQDLCQEVFIKVYQNLGSFQQKSKLSTWITRIAYNTCFNYLEKKRPGLLDENSPTDSFTAAETSFSSPEIFTQEKNTSEIIQREILNMPVKYRAIITMYHYNSMNYQEISQATGLPEGTVKSHLFRGRQFLKDKLLSQYAPEEI